MRTRLRFVAFALVGGILLAAPSAVATTQAAPAVTLTIAAGNGVKAGPAVTLTRAELAALAQANATVTIGGKKLAEQGPLLTTVIAKAALRASTACENEGAMYWFEVTGSGGASAVIVSAELVSDGGNRHALLSLSENGAHLAAPRLIMTGDKNGARDLTGVNGITIGRVAQQIRSTTQGCDPVGFKPPVHISTAPADIGAVVVNGVVPKQTITFPRIEAIRPQVTQVDTYTGEGEQKIHREHGPTLYDFLVKADPALKSLGSQGLRYYVEVSSSEDGSSAVVSWAEIDPAFDGKPFLLSTYEDGDLILDTDSGPRLTTPGDAGGTRYDYGIQAVTVFQAP